MEVHGSGTDNGMKNFNTRDATTPCQGCVIVWMHAELEYLDGKTAGVEDGMWLHHTVQMNLGRNAVKNCKDGQKERFFASGNEKTVADLSANG